MPQLLYLGLLLALVGSPLLMALFKSLRCKPFSVAPRLTLWVAAVVTLVIAATNVEPWRMYVGLEWPTWQSVALAILAATILIVAFGAYASLRSRLGSASPEQLEIQQTLLHLPFSRRCFVVVTAAVTEEVLYRGYAIGVGQHLLGGLWLACILSITVFTLAHFRWGFVHLIPVLLCALVITLLFVFTQNLPVCILVHAIVDGVGILVMPIIMARRRPASVTR